jgi:predicted MFS family arabinose efflux permease
MHSRRLTGSDPAPAHPRPANVSAALESPTTDTAAQVEPGRTSMLAALRYRDFRLFWIGLLLSNVGTWMQMFGLGWLVVQLAVRAGTPQLAPLYLGLVGLARAIPGLALGLFAGAVVDRAERRRLLLVTQVAAGLLSLLLGTLTASDNITIVAVLLIGAASSVVFSFDAPTRQSMVRRLVPHQDVMSAIGLNSAAFNGPQIIGPAIGGILIGVTGVEGLFFANAASYLAVVVALLLMRPIPAVAAPVRRTMLGSVREGVGYMRRDPVIRWVIVLAAVTSLFARPYIFLLPAVAENVLRVGATELSWLMTATGIGAFTGSITVANLGNVRRRGRMFLFFVAAIGVSLTLFSLQAILAAALAAAVLVGLTTMVFMGLANTILQTSSQDHMLGRVMSAYTMIFMGLLPLGQLLLGALGSIFGIDVVLTGGGIVTVAAAILAFGSLPDLRDLRSTRRPHAHPHPKQSPIGAD